eukprot:143952-Pelagomonas_calceolata.AAC.1
MRGMVEGEAILAYREGVCMCPEDLATVACAEIRVKDTVKLKRERKEKSTPAKSPRALRKGSLASKLERVSPKGPQA